MTWNVVMVFVGPNLTLHIHERAYTYPYIYQTNCYEKVTAHMDNGGICNEGIVFHVAYNT